ncbi:MAG: hypothetical protein AB7G13_17620 [Lautropia sp.]
MQAKLPSRKPAVLEIATMRGAVLPTALILLLVLAVSSVGFVKLINTSSLVARNASFQRDAVNRNELAINRALRAFDNVAGAHFAQLANTDQTALGVGSGLAYSAVALPTDSQGVPLVLKSDTAFAAMFAPVLATTQIASGDSMTTRLVIDRLCALEQPADSNHCSIGSFRAPDQCSRCSSASSPSVPVFRVTARTDGPRGVEAYTQTLIAVPFE